MPNITEYTSPISGIQPSGAAEAAFQQVGRRAGALGSQEADMLRQSALGTARAVESVGEGIDTLGKLADRHEAQQEILGGAFRLADVVSTLDSAREQLFAEADPFDPDVGRNFKEKAHQVLTDFAGSFNTEGGRAWATHQVASAATDIYRQTSALEMKRASDMAKLGVTETINKLGAQVVKNPDFLDTAIGLVPNTFKAIFANSNIPEKLRSAAETATTQEAIRHLVKNGITASMNNDPGAGLSLLNSDKYGSYLTPEDRTQLAHHAEVVTNLKTAQANHDEVTARKLEDQQFKDIAGSVYNSLWQRDAQGQLTGEMMVPPDYAKEIQPLLTAPGYGRHIEEIERLRKLADAVKNTPAASDPAVLRSLQSGIFAADAPTTIQQVDQAFIAGKLDTADFGHIRQMVSDSENIRKIDPEAPHRINETIGFAKDIISPKNGLGALMFNTAAANQANIQYSIWARSYATRQLKAGKPLDDILTEISKPEILDRYHKMAAGGGDGGALDAARAIPAPPTSSSKSILESIFGK